MNQITVCSNARRPGRKWKTPSRLVLQPGRMQMTPAYAQQWSEGDYEDSTTEVKYPTVNWAEIQAVQSTGSGNFRQSAICPEDSILNDFVTYGRAQSEGVDAFLIGSILPVTAAIIARKVFFRWGDQKIYPNIYTLVPAGFSRETATSLECCR